jgi:hypothetical protein
LAAAKVKSIATRRFWNLFNALPSDVQALANKNYHLWRATRSIIHSISTGCGEARIASAFASETIIERWAR